MVVLGSHVAVSALGTSNVHDLGTRVGPLRPVQYKDWHDADMLAATKVVIEGGMSVRQAAELHQVPKSTLAL